MCDTLVRPFNSLLESTQILPWWEKQECIQKKKISYLVQFKTRKITRIIAPTSSIFWFFTACLFSVEVYAGSIQISPLSSSKFGDSLSKNYPITSKERSPDEESLNNLKHKYVLSNSHSILSQCWVRPFVQNSR